MLKAKRFLKNWYGLWGGVRKQGRSLSRMSKSDALKTTNRIFIAICFMLVLLVCCSEAKDAKPRGADETAALSDSKFTTPIVLRLGQDGYSQAQKLVAMNGVDNRRTSGARYETSRYLPCGGQREYSGSLQISTHIDNGYDFDDMTMKKWLSNNRIIESVTYNIRYPNAGSENPYGNNDDYVCPIVNDNVSKYFSSIQGRNVHNGLDIPIGRRVLTKWTFRNRYSTDIPGKGNVKVFAGTFTYMVVSMVPIVSFSGEGTVTVKMYLDPDTGRWTKDNWEKDDKRISLSLLTNPLEPSKATASAIEREANARALRKERGSNYTDNGDGTIKDKTTGLTWQKDENYPSKFNWYQASGTYDATLNPSSQNVCGSLSLAGRGWRLPTKDELFRLVDNSLKPTINTTYFPNAYADGYWSSTTDASYTGNAWFVFFYNGHVGSLGKSDYDYVRCVRGGQ